MLVIKIRTFRPLANKRSTPARSEFHQSADHGGDGDDPRQRGACISRPTGCIPRDSRERIERAHPRVRRLSLFLSLFLGDEGYHLAPAGTPRQGKKKNEIKKEGEGDDRRGRVARRLFRGRMGGNKNIDGSVPARGRDNRLIIHRPRDRAGYSERSPAHMTSLNPSPSSLQCSPRERGRSTGRITRALSLCH